MVNANDLFEILHNSASYESTIYKREKTCRKDGINIFGVRSAIFEPNENLRKDCIKLSLKQDLIHMFLGRNLFEIRVLVGKILTF